MDLGGFAAPAEPEPTPAPADLDFGGFAAPVDDDADVLANTIEVYIGYLRTKIDKPFKKPLLHTVRGFGYKLEAIT